MKNILHFKPYQFVKHQSQNGMRVNKQFGQIDSPNFIKTLLAWIYLGLTETFKI
jgi:hypothetical protein